jgi:hypothetical protein
MNTTEPQACETPLIELLEHVPVDARHIEEEEFSATYHAVGRLCRLAAAQLRQQQADLEHMWMANTVLEAENQALKAKLDQPAGEQ